VALKAGVYGTPTTVGDHLRIVRLKRRLLQRHVAATIGVCVATVIHWETGDTQPTPQDGPGIVRFLGYLPLPTTTVAEQMYAIRFQHGWNQEQAAEAAGVSEDGWRAWESGSKPTHRSLARLEPLLKRLGDFPREHKPASCRARATVPS
jgi:transcriptional regulator with XRE-family HTH domain